MPTHDSSSNAAVNASIEFTKQLALSFIAIVLMLFIVVSERNRHTPQYTRAADVKGVTEQKVVSGTKVTTKKANDAWANQQILTCEMCMKHGKKTLCMEPGRKMSYCSDSRTTQTNGGVCVVCGEKPRVSITKPPYPTGHTCLQWPSPPENCYYEKVLCSGSECPICPEPKLICREAPNSR